jgi:hypothetical protein
MLGHACAFAQQLAPLLSWSGCTCKTPHGHAFCPPYAHHPQYELPKRETAVVLLATDDHAELFYRCRAVHVGLHTITLSYCDIEVCCPHEEFHQPFKFKWRTWQDTEHALEPGSTRWTGHFCVQPGHHQAGRCVHDPYDACFPLHVSLQHDDEEVPLDSNRLWHGTTHRVRAMPCLPLCDTPGGVRAHSLFPASFLRAQTRSCSAL